jgi:hypothetical protein
MPTVLLVLYGRDREDMVPAPHRGEKSMRAIYVGHVARLYVLFRGRVVGRLE